MKVPLLGAMLVLAVAAVAAGQSAKEPLLDELGHQASLSMTCLVKRT